MIKNNPQFKIFNESHIGWAILIVGFLFSAGAGIAVGLILASFNWSRLGKKRRAFGSLGIGLFSAILLSAVDRIWKIQNPDPSTLQLIASVIIQGLLILLSIAIVEKLLKKDLGQTQSDGTNFETFAMGATAGATLVGVAVIGAIMVAAVFGVELYMAPKVKVTSEFVAGGNQSIIGSIRAWSKEPIANRQLALCQLTEHNPLSPYDCLVTKYTATTDSSGKFQIKEVPAGKYLILYNAGLADFQKGLAIWQGKEIKPGNLQWEVENYDQLFSDCGKDFYLVIPDGSPSRDFYFYRVQYVFTQCGSYFFLAHDINTAITYKEKEVLARLPNDVFNPIVVEVAPHQDSIVEFDVLYAPR